MALKLLEETKSGLVQVEDDSGDTFYMRKNEYEKRVVKATKKDRVFKNKVFKKFTPTPVAWMRVVEILKTDSDFKMPISCSPEDEVEVFNEICDADSGLTIASDKKQAISYDVVFHSNQELESLLRNMGVTSVPFFNREVVRLAHGPRKSFYMKLLDSGFEPSKLGE